MKKLDFYDSDLKSDNPDEFLSDHEPPKDIVREKKLLKKSELFRIQKEIWQIGKDLPKPAKYDEINLRFQKVEDVDAPLSDIAESTQSNEEGGVNNAQAEEVKLNFDQYISQVKESSLIVTNLGLNSFEEWVEDVIESMKKGEVCYITLEFLKFDINGMKVLDKKEFYMFYLSDWTTVIDLKQDMTILKKLITKGTGNHRSERCDEVILNYRLSKGEITIEERTSNEPARIEHLLTAGMSEAVWRVLRSMKHEEVAEAKIKQKAFMDMESEPWKALHSELDLSNNDKAENQYNLTIQLKSLVRIDDIFGDGSAVKKEILKGNSTAKPEKMAKIYFEIRIEIDGKIIYETLPGDFPILPSNKINEFAALEEMESAWKYYLDELKISKFLKNALRRMKKQEYAIIECRDKSLVLYGRDFDIINAHCAGVIPYHFLYHVKLYNFTEGKNTFSMTIDEKIEQAQRKKIVGLKLIAEKNFKKACKTFESINGFFELGKFIGEDAVNVHPHKLSSLLNTSLCYQKLGKWDRLLATCDKIIEMEPNHSKGIYRKVLVYENQSDFNSALVLINDHIKAKGSSIEPAVLAEFNKLKTSLEKRQVEYLSKQKKIYSKLFN